MKYIVSFVFTIILLYSSAFGKILRVNYPGNAISDVDFRYFEDANDNAANGDTIQVYGDVRMQTNTGCFIKKRLVIQGMGYNFDVNTNLQLTSLNSPSRFLGNVILTFDAGSENSVMEGCFAVTDASQGPPTWIEIATSNITIRRCCIGIQLDNSLREIRNTRIEDCVITLMNVEKDASKYPTTNTQILNCIIEGYINANKEESTGIVTNCVQVPYEYPEAPHPFILRSAKFVVKNSFLSSYYPSPNTSWENCFFRANQPDELPKGSNNQWVVYPSYLFDRLGGNSDVPGKFYLPDTYYFNSTFAENYYQLKAGSLAIKAGFDSNGDSTDCGIFGGDSAFRYQLSGVPAIPAVYKLSASSTEATANPYNVSVSIRSNSTSNISQVEYFIDADPGMGNGTKLSITPNIELENLIIPINPEHLSPCQHTLYVRALDADGHWSFTYMYAFTNNTVSPTFAVGDYMLQLDGIDDYLNLGTWFNLPNFTLSFWVKPAASQTKGAAIAALQNDLYLYANPDVQNNYILSHLLQFDLAPDKWNYVTIAVDGAKQLRKVYLFGQLIDSNYWSYSPSSNFNLRFGNGGFFPNSYFKGQLDDIKLWNYDLSSNEIYQSMNIILTGTEPGLVGYWNFNNGCTADVVDKSTYHHDGSLVN